MGKKLLCMKNDYWRSEAVDFWWMAVLFKEMANKSGP